MAEEKKIIIDEDWKSQVQAEKAAAQSKLGDQPESPKAAPAEDFAMPPASLELLVTTLATEAMMALGQIPHPLTGQAEFHPQQAQYIIDTIDVLREKTKGNTTPAESKLFEELLHQLRIAFVHLKASASSHLAAES